MLCINCGFENPSGFKFCGECGTPIAKDSQELKPHKKHKDEAERRQLTVMFCDLVGSTYLSQQLDPEELRDVIKEYQGACAEVISHFDGHLAKYLGDGILVYFGYPRAHEDDANRAVRAGLEIVGVIHELPLHNTQLQQALQVRIGIHTGLVVAGEMGGGKRREPMAIVGETPNVAARLQGLAEPNTVVISGATHKLVEGFFEHKNLGMHALKGISTPMEVYQVLQESGVYSRFEAAVTKGLTPLVGREQEVGILLDRWQQAKEGRGQVVLIGGEAGIGKSRLVQMMKESLAGESHARIEVRCSPFYQNSALYPLIDNLQRVLQFSREDSSEEKLGKLEKTLEQYDFPLREVFPLFASLLSLPLPDYYPPLNLTPQKQKQKTLEAFLAWMLKEAERDPMLSVVEDLHWVDSSTLEYLSLLVERVPSSRIFALFTFHPNFSPPWPIRSHMTQIMLNRFTRKQAEVMVERGTGGKAFPAEVIQQIVNKTDGVPLFVEELTKMVLESGLLSERESYYELTGPLPSLAIPTTLQDSLMARLDRLATAKEVAQLGATLGREFTYELLQTVSPLDETTLQRELGKLVKAELLYQRGPLPQAKYFFKHSLIQQAAYQSLLKSKRQHYHQIIAQVLEEKFPETVETQPEFLAYHYTEAGSREQAIPYWQKAGQRAIERSANLEAIGHLTKGLELLKNMPETPEHTQQELTLQIALGVPLIATKGGSSPEVEKVYTRARELCKKVGETPQLFPVLFGLWRVYIGRAELQTARNLGEELLSLAQSVKDPALFLQAHHALWTTLSYLGDLSLARKHLEQGIALYHPQQYKSHAFIYGGHDPGVCCRSYLAWVLWLLGYPEQALKKSQEALKLAQDLSHPNSLAIALDSAAIVHQLCREEQAVREQAEAIIALSLEQEFRFSLALGTIMRGWALAELGQREEGITQMRQGMAAFRGTGSELGLSYTLSLLGEVFGKGGQTEEGLSVLDEALDMVDRNGERRWEAELYRLKGELLLGLSQDNHKDVETCFCQAIDVARRQSAKSLELRAVMSLGRLWEKRGKKEEARKMLSEIYGWFTEGFESKDIKEAKALLEELS